MKAFEREPYNNFMYILYILYKIYFNLISTVMKHDYRDYIDKIQNQNLNVSKSHKTITLKHI